MHADVLDHGALSLIDYMGNDASVVAAARVSTRDAKYADQPDPAGDVRLINYLIRHGHMTPFEMCELKFYVKAPLFVAREWFRHRMGHFNEMSLRYREAPTEYYTPENFRRQASRNKQSSTGIVADDTHVLHDLWRSQVEGSVRAVGELRSEHVAREQANRLLPMNMYTEFYWKVDLRNCLAFLKLRLGEDAQWEIRQYAVAIAGVVAVLFPTVWAAFLEHDLCAFKVSYSEFMGLISDQEAATDLFQTMERFRFRMAELSGH